MAKRWTDEKGFHAIQRCRKCDEWKRSDMELKPADAKPTRYVRKVSDGLQNSASNDIDPDTGDLK